MLAASLPLKVHDDRSYFAWWQLPSVPLTQEMAFADTSGAQLLSTLPPVLLGVPYPDLETYLGTYMRLHRADCFYDVTCAVNRARVQSKEQASSADQLKVYDRILVGGIAVSDADSEMSVQLSVAVKDPTRFSLSYNTLCLGHMVAVSVLGNFSDSSLVWGIITQGPTTKERAACTAAAKAYKLHSSSFSVAAAAAKSTNNERKKEKQGGAGKEAVCRISFQVQYNETR
jgi:hypothetical protein